MNEKEAWLYIAEAYEIPRLERNKNQTFLAEFGICHALVVIDISSQICLIMDNKVLNDLLQDRIYFCARDEAGDKFRAEYCRKQASLL